MTGPTNLNPRFFKSLLNNADSFVDAGTSSCDFQSFKIGFPSTNCHTYLSKLPNSSCTFTNMCGNLKKYRKNSVALINMCGNLLMENQLPHIFIKATEFFLY